MEKDQYFNEKRTREAESLKEKTSSVPKELVLVHLLVHVLFAGHEADVGLEEFFPRAVELELRKEVLERGLGRERLEGVVVQVHVPLENRGFGLFPVKRGQIRVQREKPFVVLRQAFDVVRVDRHVGGDRVNHEISQQLHPERELPVAEIDQIREILSRRHILLVTPTVPVFPVAGLLIEPGAPGREEVDRVPVPENLRNRAVKPITALMRFDNTADEIRASENIFPSHWLCHD